jgi:hypothetical protein
VQAITVIWDDRDIDWSTFDLVVLRSPWDYIRRREDFVAWARSVRRLANPADVVEWNTDKRYLADLAAAGIPVIPTAFLAPDEAWAPPAYAEYVIKPAVSAGSQDTGRYGRAHEAEARALVTRLQRGGRLTMVQPYLPAVDTYGETSLLYFADPANGMLRLSHAIRKGPMLTGPDNGVEALYKEEDISPREPSAAEVAVGDAVISTVPHGLLYARVDLIPDPEGNPLLIELELTEPSLFFGYAQGAAERFARSVAAKVR